MMIPREVRIATLNEADEVLQIHYYSCRHYSMESVGGTAIGHQFVEMNLLSHGSDLKKRGNSANVNPTDVLMFRVKTSK